MALGGVYYVTGKLFRTLVCVCVCLGVLSVIL